MVIYKLLNFRYRQNNLIFRLWSKLSESDKMSLSRNLNFLVKINSLHGAQQIKDSLGVMHPVDYILMSMFKNPGMEINEDYIQEMIDLFNIKSNQLKIPSQNISPALNKLKVVNFESGKFRVF